MKFLLTLLLILIPAAVGAAPVALAVDGPVSVTLYDEPCTVDVSNLKLRAVWTEAGKTFEGCYGVFGRAVVGAYFSDKSVVVLPVQMFQPAKDI